jgi:hypothetical protein
LGFESHKEKRRRGTGERFADLQKRSVCMYLCDSKTVYAKIHQEGIKEIKQGAIEEESASVIPATCCMAVVKDVKLIMRVRGLK